MSKIIAIPKVFRLKLMIFNADNQGFDSVQVGGKD